MKETNKMICALAYILFFVPLIADSENSEYRFHANQGLILFLAGIILTFVGMIPFIGWVLAPIFGIAILVFAIMGIVNALNGNMKELPLIGKFQLIK